MAKFQVITPGPILDLNAHTMTEAKAEALEMFKPQIAVKGRTYHWSRHSDSKVNLVVNNRNGKLVTGCLVRKVSK